MRTLVVFLLMAAIVGAVVYESNPPGSSVRQFARKYVSSITAAFDPDSQALEDFKKSRAAQSVDECVGVNGDVKWEIFSEAHAANSSVRVIQANLQKENGDKLEVQWRYNLDTKVTQVAYIADPRSTAPTTSITIIETFAVYCPASLLPNFKGLDNSTGGNGESGN